MSSVVAAVLETLFGLPAHPLVVHAAVVLLPLAVIATVVSAAISRVRRAYALVALALAVAASVAVGLAQVSGAALEDSVDETELVEEHTEQGERVLPWALGLSVVAAAVAIAGPTHRRFSQLSVTWFTAVLTVLALLVGTGAMWAVIRVGHSGAKATWNDVSRNGANDDSGPGPGDDDNGGGADRDD